MASSKLRQRTGDPYWLHSFLQQTPTSVPTHSAAYHSKNTVGYNSTILEAPKAKIRLTFEVNTLSHFHIAKEFLPAMIKANHGHVVTVATSVLAFHEGLRQELKYSYCAPNHYSPNLGSYPLIKALTENEGNFSRRILTCQVVSTAICEQILKHHGGQVIVPGYQSPISLVRGMPTWIPECVRTYASNSLKRIRNPQDSAQDVQ
ncbi:uncharacterized protein N7446_010641 [Penicillium canescens]|uniref:Uncharacterized protein n=1 Tax=Penicillium canescens TaxID=5083 RepID=A0AAD6N9A9_PENCN|nr:uncharacterized protein N7446_010641 [Penicillium canescens]KAJ6041474.1 hypothetical protein N7460_006864 [Penicillium canescens]KAJ6050532.1 hypothetical protein N7446_010641 [Penicillium canescens]KAJ6064834.1 hypothetical protein N7444_000487 [Penicillium canescens]